MMMEKGKEKKEKEGEEEKDKLERTVLYIGLDDSNHAWNKKIGEVVAAVFSFNCEDSVIKRHPHTRDSSFVNKWFKNPNRDYLFAILTREEFRHTSTNLPYAAHYVIEHYLKNNTDYASKIEMYLDGWIRSWQKERLKEHFNYIKDCPRITIRNFPKKKGVHECPTVVYVADIQARRLFRTPLEKLNENPGLITVPFNEEIFNKYRYKYCRYK